MESAPTLRVAPYKFIGGSKPPPYNMEIILQVCTKKTGGYRIPCPPREHSSLRRFGYKQFTELFALRVAPYDIGCLKR